MASVWGTSWLTHWLDTWEARAPIVPALITSWSLTAPNGTHYQPSISVAGVVSWTVIGAPITLSPPVYADQLDPDGTVHTPSISNAAVVSTMSGPESGQSRAGLLDPNGLLYIASVVGGVSYFIAPQVRVGDLVTFGLYTQESVPLIVKSITPGPDLTARLTFVDAAPGVHLAASGIIPPFESHITLPRIGQEPVAKPFITAIASDETVMLRSTDGSLVPRIVISLQFASGAISPAVSLEVQHRLHGSPSPWERQLFTASSLTEVSILSVMEGLNYDLRVRSIGALGQTSEWVMVENYAVIGKTAPPPSVTGLSLNGNQLVWSYPAAPPDLAGFLVRVQVGQRTSWGDAMPLHDGVVSQTSFVLFRDSGQRTYLVKAIDTSRNESLTAASIFVDYGALAISNIAELLDFKTLGFPGTLTDGSLIGGNLLADSDTLFWKSDGQPFWTEDAALFWVGTYEAMVYTVTITPPLAWLGGTLLLDLDVASAGYRLDYAQDSGTPFWGDGSAPFWSSDAALFWSGAAAVFVPWPGQLTGYTRQAYQIRITTSAGNVQGVIAQLQAIFDMPDLEEILSDVVLPAATTRLVLTKLFSAILAVTPLPHTGIEKILVFDREASGPLVLAVDAAGLPVSGVGDFIVRGY